MTEREATCGGDECINTDEDDYDDDDDDDEEDVDGRECFRAEHVECLFCRDEFFTSLVDTFEHCKNKHGFDIFVLKKELKLDCYSYIRLVNYIRKNCLQSIDDMDSLREALTNDEYMKPVLDDDPLLMFDIEAIVESSEDEYERTAKTKANTLEETERRLKEAEDRLMLAFRQMDKMKELFIESLDNNEGTSLIKSKANDSEGYFSSYAHFGIHHEMLQDVVRTVSYRDAMFRNEDLLKGKIVLDVGCGTGILSMFAARSGAANVYGVDQSEIIYRAMDIVRENHLEESVTLLKGRLEDVTIPNTPVDIIVSEWMGYFLLFESMLDTVVYARDKYLKEGGTMLPNRFTIIVAGLCDLEAHAKLITFWDDVFGFKMSCFKQEVVREATVEVVAKEKIITAPCNIKEIDLMTCSSRDIQFAQEFQLNVLEDGSLTAIVGWFDTFFDLPNKISFSTSPSSTTTHWKQTIFYLQNPIPVKKGTSIDAKISCDRFFKDPRSLNVKLTVQNVQQSYVLQ